MIDRKTKVLLLAIALGLWANVAVQFVLPRDLHAGTSLSQQDAYLSNIDANVQRISRGTCSNSKIC